MMIQGEGVSVDTSLPSECNGSVDLEKGTQASSKDTILRTMRHIPLVNTVYVDQERKERVVGPDAAEMGQKLLRIWPSKTSRLHCTRSKPFASLHNTHDSGSI